MGIRSSSLLGGQRAAACATVALLTLVLVAGCSGTPNKPGEQSAAPKPSATVPAPGGGTVDDVETAAPSADPADLPKTPIDKPARLNDGMVVTVTDTRRVETKAETPGEVAGPAVAVRLKITNGSAGPVDLSTVMVSVTGDKGAFGQPTTSAPASPFSGELAAGDSAEGVYVFGLPADARDDLSIRVEYVAGAPVALFVGQI